MTAADGSRASISGRGFVPALLAAVAAVLLDAGRADAYIEIPYTLGRIVNESTNIVLMKVDKVNKERRLIYYVKIADLKGKHPSDKINHQIQNGFHPREPKYIMDWAEPGKIAIFFHNGGASETCIGDYWYQSYPAAAPWWSMSHSEPFLGWAFFGSITKLESLVKQMLEGKEVIIPCAQCDYAKLQEFKNLLHEKKAPLWRMKGSLKLTDHERMIRHEKDKWVVGLGAYGPEAVPEFVKKLKEGDPAARAAAAEELGQIGPEAKAGMEPLGAALGDKEGLVRVRAAEAILRIDPAAGGKAIDLLSESLGDDALSVVAASTLAGVGPAAKPAVPALLKTLKGGKPAARMAAAEAIGRLEPTNAELTGVLAGLTTDADKGIAGRSAELLGSLGAAAKPAIPALVKVLAHADPEVRGKGAEALAKLAPDSVPALIAVLKDGPGEAKSAALDALAATGGHAGSAVDVLTTLLKDAGLRNKAAAVLRPFAARAPAAVADMTALLGSPDRDARLLAAGFLAEAGPAAKDAIPALIKVLSSDTSGTVRTAAATALGRQGPAAASAADALLAGLTDPLIVNRDISYRSAFATAWGAVKGPTKGATVELFGDNAHLSSAQLLEGGGQVTVEDKDKKFGATSLRVTPDQKFNPAVAGWSFPIVEKPAEGQYRYIRFAWKKVGGAGMMMQLSAGGDWNRRLVAGRNVANWQPSLIIADKVPAEWTVVTRDLFADFKGPFTLTGLAISPVDGNYALIDGIVLGRTIEDLDKVMPAK